MIETTCKYMLRCGWCDKRNIQCPQNDSVVFNTNSEISNAPPAVFYPPSETETDKTFPGHTGIESCKWEWVCFSTLGNHYRCSICGATKIEPIGNSTISNSTIKGVY